MQSRLAKTLYLGLAALSFGAVATVSTTASAKSKAHVISNTTMSSDPTTRNVELTGSNAIYSKPGTVKGARIVASKYTAGNLGASKSSNYYFRAYRQAVTNRGSVYYKVVSMSGKYRGYIYGGKDTNSFGGGVKAAKTTQTANLPASTTATFVNPGTKHVTWNAPKYTQYKAKKMVKSTAPYANDKLTITKAATKTREGWLYYYVEDAQNPNVNGWIYADSVKLADSNTVAAKDGITLNFINKATGQAVSSKVVAMPTGATTSITNYQAIQLANANLPAGYTYSNLGTSATVAKGGAVAVYLIQNPGNTLNLSAKVLNTDVSQDAQNLLTANWNTASVQDALKKDKTLNQPEGTTLSGDAIVKALTANKLDTITIPTPQNGGTVAYQYKLAKSDTGIFSSKGSTTVYYTATRGTMKNNVFVAD